MEAVSLWSGQGQGVGPVRAAMPAADIFAQIHLEGMACVWDAQGLDDADVGSAAATGVNADTVCLATTGRREEATMRPNSFSSDSFLKGYVDAFQAFDAARIASFYNAPCLSVRPDGSIHGFSDRDEIAAFFGRVVAAYRAEGMVSFQAGDVRCHPQGSASASLACTWAMKRGDGGVIRSWAQTYTVQRVAEDWRIVASVIHL